MTTAWPAKFIKIRMSNATLKTMLVSPMQHTVYKKKKKKKERVDEMSLMVPIHETPKPLDESFTRKSSTHKTMHIQLRQTDLFMQTAL